MNLTRFFLLALALILAGFAPLRAATEKEALDAFKADIEKLDAEGKTQQAQLGGDPAAGVKMVRQMCKQLRAVRTDGLPADLKTAYTDLVASLGRFEKVFEGFPETGAEFQTYIQNKVLSDPTFLQKFQTDLGTVTGEIQPKVVKLDELGKKYGIDKLGEFGKNVAK